MGKNEEKRKEWSKIVGGGEDSDDMTMIHNLCRSSSDGKVVLGMWECAKCPNSYMKLLWLNA